MGSEAFVLLRAKFTQTLALYLSVCLCFSSFLCLTEIIHILKFKPINYSIDKLN